MERKLKITTGRQFQTLVSELEKHPYLARGFHGGASPNTIKHDWDEITIKLNALGPPVRDMDGWLKVWRDFKCKVKRKISLMEAEMNSTDGSKFKRVILHPLEKTVANLMQFYSHSSTKVAPPEIQPVVEGIKTEHFEEMKTDMLGQTIWEEDEEMISANQSAVEEIKTENYYVLEQTFLGDEEDLPCTSGNSFRMQTSESSNDRRKRKRNRKSDERQELLEKHNAMQEKVFNEISDTLIELKTILKESGRYHQKLVEVEEKKLKLMERRNEREEQLVESEMKLKLMEMKIKTKELEALEKGSLQ